MTTLEFGGMTWIARADRSLWQPERRTLVIADLHLAKSHAFRCAGIPISDAIERDDLSRLNQAITDTRASTLWILGDLLHSPAGLGPHIARFLQELSLPTTAVHVILGNHDQAAAKALANAGLQTYPDPTPWESIEFAHFPESTGHHRPRIAGHMHPMVTYRSRRDRLRFPCFAYIDEDTLVLPAFTRFSGGSDLNPRQVTCYPIVADQVLSPYGTPPTIELDAEDSPCAD